MNIEEILEPVACELDAVESFLKAWAEDDLPLVSDAINHIIRSGGKRLRPACVLLAAGLGRDGGRDAVEFAAAVEIIHTASLVHDDIIDRAPVRRGAPSLHARWGEGIALLVGDLLYSRLFQRLTRREGGAEALRVVAETVHKMVLGELAEILRRDDLTLTETDYVEIVENKTGALFSCAMYLGAWAGGLSRRDCTRLARYGQRLGLAYQMIDDILDFCEGERESGKQAGTDLREGKVTLPVIHALRTGDGRVARLFREKESAGFCAAIEQAGSLSYALEKAEATIREAMSCLEGLPEGPNLRSLADVGRYVAFRGRQALARGPVELAEAGRERTGAKR